MRATGRHDPRERWLRLGVVVAVVVLVVGGGIGLQLWRTHRAPTVPAGLATAPGAPQAVVAGRPIVLGSAGAPVRAQLYVDFHCPHCAEFEERYGETVTAALAAGSAAVELYPMAFIDDGSAAAGGAMACATEAGIAQPYYLGLFANHQLAWRPGQLVTLGQGIAPGLPDTFETCVRSGRHADWVASINAAAEQAGVNQTPALLIGGARVDIAALTTESLRAKLAG